MVEKIDNFQSHNILGRHVYLVDLLHMIFCIVQCARTGTLSTLATADLSLVGWLIDCGQSTRGMAMVAMEHM